MPRECLVGLDIGTTKVAAFVGEVAKGGEVEIVGMGEAPSRGIKRGVVVDIDEASAAIAQAIQAATTATGYDIHSVIVGVTGEHIASLNSKAVVAIPPNSREITAADVDKAIEQSRVIVLPPDREIINAVPRSYIVDGQDGIRYPVGMSGARLEVETHIVTGAIALLRNVAKAIHQAGLSVEATVLEPIASAEAVLSTDERNLGVAVVDVGGGTSDIAIFVDGDVFYSSVVPIGGSFVTRDISIGLRVSLDEAERIKRRYGNAAVDVGRNRDDVFSGATLAEGDTQQLPLVDLEDIIQARMEELFEHVGREIKKSGYHSMLPAGIILTGGGAELAGAAQLCKNITGLPTRLGIPSNALKIDSKYQSPMYATGIGLVLYGAHYTLAGAQGYRAHGYGQLPAGLGGFAKALQRFFARIMGAGDS